MSACFSLQVRGWSQCTHPEVLCVDYFGMTCQRIDLEPNRKCWQVIDHLAPQHPIGYAPTLISIVAEAECEVALVPGSQGKACPLESLGHALVSVALVANTALVFDGRCWFRLPFNAVLKVSLWRPDIHGVS